MAGDLLERLFSAGNNSQSLDVDKTLKMSGQFHIMIGQDKQTSHKHILSYVLQGVCCQLIYNVLFILPNAPPVA